MFVHTALRTRHSTIAVVWGKLLIVPLALPSHRHSHRQRKPRPRPCPNTSPWHSLCWQRRPATPPAARLPRYFRVAGGHLADSSA